MGRTKAQLGTDEIIGEETTIFRGRKDIARRNAFLMLFNHNEDLPIEILANSMDDVGKYGYGFDILVLDLTRRV